METLNKEIKVKANYSKRTFTIRIFIKGVLNFKYRTYKMSLDEFNSSLHMTNNDWRNFLKTNDYYLVKSY